MFPRLLTSQTSLVSSNEMTWQYKMWISFPEYLSCLAYVKKQCSDSHMERHTVKVRVLGRWSPWWPGHFYTVQMCFSMFERMNYFVLNSKSLLTASIMPSFPLWWVSNCNASALYSILRTKRVRIIILLSITK